MNVVHSDQPLAFVGRSIFLAGPTPRRTEVLSWRPEALDSLRGMGFDGTVFIPERTDWRKDFDYSHQVEWEFGALERADVVLFWIPRHAADLPGFTTNVEFGRYVGSGRAIYGRPDLAPNNRYLDWLYLRLTGRAPCTSLEETLRAAVQMSQRSE